MWWKLKSTVKSGNRVYYKEGALSGRESHSFSLGQEWDSTRRDDLQVACFALHRHVCISYIYVYILLCKGGAKACFTMLLYENLARIKNLFERSQENIFPLNNSSNSSTFFCFLSVLFLSLTLLLVLFWRLVPSCGFVCVCLFNFLLLFLSHPHWWQIEFTCVLFSLSLV